MDVFFFGWMALFATMKWILLRRQWPYIKSWSLSLFHLMFNYVPDPNLFVWMNLMRFLLTILSLPWIVICYIILIGAMRVFLILSNMSKSLGDWIHDLLLFWFLFDYCWVLDGVFVISKNFGFVELSFIIL